MLEYYVIDIVYYRNQRHLESDLNDCQKRAHGHINKSDVGHLIPL